MKNMKRVLLALLAVLLMCVVVGCGGNDPSSPTGGNSAGIPLGITMIQINGATVSTSIGTYSIGSSDSATSRSGAFADATAHPVTVASFKIAESELTYEKWYEVYQWAVSDDRGTGKYTFANKGAGGPKGTAGKAPTSYNKQYPVTQISWRDAVIWCNAASEREGLTPAYYLEGTTVFTDKTKVVRESESSQTAAGGGKADKAVVNPSSNGYRLPTNAEWEFAARGGDPSATTYWNATKAGNIDWTSQNCACGRQNSSTADMDVVKSYQATSIGLYDIQGNAAEITWDRVTRNSDIRFLKRGGAYRYNESSICIEQCLTEYINMRSSDVGIRLVRSAN